MIRHDPRRAVYSPTRSSRSGFPTIVGLSANGPDKNSRTAPAILLGSLSSPRRAGRVSSTRQRSGSPTGFDLYRHASFRQDLLQRNPWREAPHLIPGLDQLFEQVSIGEDL